MPWKVHNFIIFTAAAREGSWTQTPFSLSSLPCCIWSIPTNITNDQAILALPSQVAHSVCSKEHRHNQAFGWMHNSHWIGQIFGFKYRSASSNWNINKGSLWEPNVHKGRTEGKRKKEVFKGWAGATKTKGAICLFPEKVGALAQEVSKASPDWPSYSSFRKWYVSTVLIDSKVEFVIRYKCTMKLSNRNSSGPGTQLYLKRELGWSLFVPFSYCPSWPPDHARVSFTDWKTLQSTEEVLVTSWAPTPRHPLTHNAAQHIQTSRPKGNVCHTHSSFIMPCFMDGLIFRHPPCMWALRCPSAPLSHILFLLKGSEIPISDFPKYLAFLAVPHPALHQGTLQV